MFYETFFCLSVGYQVHVKTTDWIFMKIFLEM